MKKKSGFRNEPDGAAAARLAEAHRLFPGWKERILKCTQDDEIKKGEAQGLFYPVTTETGHEWRISATLAERQTNLLNFAHIQDDEIRGAFLALCSAQMRAGNKIAVHDPESVTEREEDADNALMKFLVPLAKRLPGAKSQKEAEAIKAEALRWVGEVINRTFPRHLQSNEDERRAAELIEIAFQFCREENRLPTKDGLSTFAHDRISKKAWNWGPTKWAKLYKLAGVNKLKRKARAAVK